MLRRHGSAQIECIIHENVLADQQVRSRCAPRLARPRRRWISMRSRQTPRGMIVAFTASSRSARSSLDGSSVNRHRALPESGSRNI